jgi:hypothetical protein
LVDLDRIIDEWTEDNRLTYEDIEVLGIKKPGHIFKILTKLELDAKILDENLYFLIFGNTKTSLLRISSEKTTCCGFTTERTNVTNDLMKIDLVSWLRKIGLMHLRTNFVFNGFDNIQFFILQMFTAYSIDDNIVENCLHIYNKKERNIILEQLAKDVNNINIRLSRMNYLRTPIMEEENVIDEGCKMCNIF